MSAFLIACVIVEAVEIGVLFWRYKQLSIGLKNVSDRLSLTAREESVSRRLASHLDALTNLAKEHFELDSRIKELLRKNEITDTYIGRTEALIESELAAFKSAIVVEMYQTESKVSDLAEGCEKLDSDLSIVMADVQELVRLRHADVKETGERIAQIAEDQEKARRKSARPGAPNQAFSSVRGIAEANSFRADPVHDQLVALAEGSE